MLPKQYLKPLIVTALAICIAAVPTAAARPVLDQQQRPPHVAGGSDKRSIDETDTAAVRARAQVLANHVPPAGRISTAATHDAPAVRLVTLTVPSHGFDWGDAAIGAAVAAAIALLIAAGGVAIRQHNHPAAS
jgi:hypothetical protein